MTAVHDRGKPVMVHIVDDDERLSYALVDLFASVGIRARSYSSSAAFLSEPPVTEGCILLDVRMPGINGLELQGRLEQSGSHVPIIFMTGHGDIPMTVRALKAGALDFLEKPFREQALLDAVSEALKKDDARQEVERRKTEVRRLMELLTPREEEIMRAVVRGLLNKQIAFELGIKLITVKIHRSAMMRKMGASSVTELTKMVESL